MSSVRVELMGADTPLIKSEDERNPMRLTIKKALDTYGLCPWIMMMMKIKPKKIQG